MKSLWKKGETRNQRKKPEESQRKESSWTQLGPALESAICVSSPQCDRPKVLCLRVSACRRKSRNNDLKPSFQTKENLLQIYNLQLIYCLYMLCRWKIMKRYMQKNLKFPSFFWLQGATRLATGSKAETGNSISLSDSDSTPFASFWRLWQWQSLIVRCTQRQMKKRPKKRRLSFVICVYRVSKKTWWNSIVFPETNSSWSTCPATLPENEGLFGLFALLAFFALFVLFVVFVLFVCLVVCLVVCLLRAGAGVERELV